MRIQDITQIIAVGSIDGTATTAALLGQIGGGMANVGIIFTQASEVDKIDPTAWLPGQLVAFVDLAVNNRDPKMTEDFVSRIKAAGHQIVAVCDEHNREDWLKILGSFDGLIIEPQSQAEGVFRSSGAVLKAALGSLADSHTIQLCEAADAADRGDFQTHFGKIINLTLKSKMGDNSRRVYLARHLAVSTQADSQIMSWMGEYEPILANNLLVISNSVWFGGVAGLVRISTIGLEVDLTVLLFELYGAGAKVVLCEGEVFIPALGKKQKMLSVSTGDKGIDLLALIKPHIPLASGFAQKVNVELGDEKEVLRLLRGEEAPDPEDRIVALVRLGTMGLGISDWEMVEDRWESETGFEGGNVEVKLLTLREARRILKSWESLK